MLQVSGDALQAARQSVYRQGQIGRLHRQPDIVVAQGNGDAVAEQLPGGGIVGPLLGVALAGVDRGVADDLAGGPALLAARPGVDHVLEAEGVAGGEVCGVWPGVGGDPGALVRGVALPLQLQRLGRGEGAVGGMAELGPWSWPWGLLALLGLLALFALLGLFSVGKRCCPCLRYRRQGGWGRKRGGQDFFLILGSCFLNSYLWVPGGTGPVQDLARGSCHQGPSTGAKSRPLLSGFGTGLVRIWHGCLQGPEHRAVTRP